MSELETVQETLKYIKGDNDMMKEDLRFVSSQLKAINTSLEDIKKILLSQQRRVSL